MVERKRARSHVIAAIDPGLKGAIAFMTRSNDAVVFDLPVIGPPKKTIINGTELSILFRQHTPQYVVVERVGVRPGEGVSSAFRFGTGFGQLLGVIQTMKIPYELVTPAVWKRSMKLSQDKELSRLTALERFPHLSEQLTRKKDHGRAEALLFGLWYLEKT